LIFRDSSAGMVPSTLGMCRYILHSEIVRRGQKKFENLWLRLSGATPLTPPTCLQDMDNFSFLTYFSKSTK